MVTPWSTNAVEITQNMGIDDISRIEAYYPYQDEAVYDPMISQHYKLLDQDLFTIDIVPEPVLAIENISDYNDQEGLSLNAEEIEYLEEIAGRLGSQF